MKLTTEPTVYLVAGPEIDDRTLMGYLDSVGAPEWETDAGSDAEVLAEFMGRLCYRSFAPGLNANVTKVREGNAEYLRHIIEVGHGSVLEHAQVSFVFSKVSRVFTHELVRHRVGVGISQESLRFVRLDDLDFWFPTWALKDEELYRRCCELVAKMEEHQLWMAEHFKLDDPGTKFEEKKHKTSFMRRFAPIGLGTTIGWSCNLRTLRHVIEMRTSLAAEEEIRLVFRKVARLAAKRFPAVFADYEENAAGEWVTKSRKI